MSWKSDKASHDLRQRIEKYSQQTVTPQLASPLPADPSPEFGAELEHPEYSDDRLGGWENILTDPSNRVVKSQQRSGKASSTYLSQIMQTQVARNHRTGNLHIREGRSENKVQFSFASQDPQNLREMWGARVMAVSSQLLAGSIDPFSWSDFCSRAVFVENIHENALNVKSVCNLLSNYGNICFGLLFRECRAAVVLYECQQGALNGIQYLHGLQFLGTELTISGWTHFEGLDPCFLFAYPDTYVPPLCNRRFKKGIPARANKVSPTLHICIFYPSRRRVVSTNDMLKKLKSIGFPPLEIRRDSNPDNHNMWFVDFKKLSDALQVLMLCHDSEFEDGNIRISFTKSKRAFQNGPGNGTPF